jgi:hypothetical protein
MEAKSVRAVGAISQYIFLIVVVAVLGIEPRRFAR